MTGPGQSPRDPGLSEEVKEGGGRLHKLWAVAGWAGRDPVLRGPWRLAMTVSWLHLREMGDTDGDGFTLVGQEHGHMSDLHVIRLHLSAWG